MHWEHLAWTEALKQEHIEPLGQQVALQVQAVEAKDTDHQTLGTLLSMAIVSRPPTAWPPPMAPQSPWVPPATPQQVPTWVL